MYLQLALLLMAALLLPKTLKGLVKHRMVAHSLPT